MINIFPIEEKKKILAEYRLRLGGVVIFAFASLISASLVLLVPSYLLANLKHKTASSELSAIESKQGRRAQENDVNTEIKAVNSEINLFLKGTPNASSTPSRTISKILDIKSKAIKIQGFTYDASVSQGRMIIVGNASNRDTLSQFIEALKMEPTFTNVELPISSYVKSTNIDFSVVIEQGVKKIKK